MKKRPLRFVIVLVVALALAPFLPFYIERTMMRTWRVDHVGDIIEWGWRLCTLKSYWENYSYASREEDPALWLGVNLGLAVIYALVIALSLDRFLARRKRRSPSD